MSRAKRGFKARRRRKKLLSLAKGYRGSRKNRIRNSAHVVYRGLAFAFRDRRVKKRDFRRLWIVRINAAARSNGLRYSELMNGLKKANVEIDRSVLADLAISDAAGFKALVQQARSALSAN
ncbi:MAG: 50S ribosomal protein L20 [Oligoflexus sp.]